MRYLIQYNNQSACNSESAAANLLRCGSLLCLGDCCVIQSVKFSGAVPMRFFVVCFDSICDFVQRDLLRCFRVLVLCAVGLFCGVLFLPVQRVVAADFLRVGTSDDDFQHARGLYRKKRWQLAADAFETFLKQHPKNSKCPFALLYRGVSLENLNQYNTARAVFRRFVVRYPQNANRNDALYRIAECSFFLNDLKNAESEFHQFLKSAPKHDFVEFALPYLGDVQFRLKKVDAAAKNFRQSIDRFPNGKMRDVSKLGLARCLKLQKNNKAALKLFTEVAQQKKSASALDAQNDLGLLHFDTGDYLTAGKSFDAISQRFPKQVAVHGKSYLDAGFAYYRAGKFTVAAERFERAARQKTLQSQANYWCGLSYKAVANYAKATGILRAEFRRNEKSSLAADLLFQWAACERLAEHDSSAQKLSLDFVKRWPKHANADDSLHFAGEMALAGNRFNEAQALVDRFRKEYRGSSLWALQMVLQGRIFTSRGGQKNFAAAVSQFQKVLKNSRQLRTQSLARFYLAQNFQQQKKPLDVLKTLEPLLKSMEKTKGRSEFSGAFLLAARSAFQLKQYQQTVLFTTGYLNRTKNRSQQWGALALRLQAFDQLGDKKNVRGELKRLAKTVPISASFSQAVHEICERAYAKNDWKWTVELFQHFEQLAVKTTLHSTALLGLAWSQFESTNYNEAIKLFRRLETDFSQNRQAASQASFMVAESLAKLGKSELAAAAYEKTFQNYAPKTAAVAGSEQKGKSHYYSFHAGLFAARQWGTLKKIKRADAAYEKLLTRFPKPKQLDLRLNEWATLNYGAENYQRADQIFRRLVRDSPKSSLADNARYSLAESDLNAGKVKKARKEFLALHTLKGADAVVKEVSLYRLIGIGMEQQQWNDVRQWGAAFVRDFPKSQHRWFALFSAAEAELRLGKLLAADQKLQTLQKQTANLSVARADWFPRVWVLRAETALRSRQYPTVVTTVAAMKKRFPKQSLLYQADDVLGRCYAKQALFGQARAAFERVTAHPVGKQTETAAKCQFLIAESHLKQEQFKKARDAYLRVDTLFSFPQWTAPALLQSGKCDEAMKNWSGARQSYQELMKRFPKNRYAQLAKKRFDTIKKR